MGLRDDEESLDAPDIIVLGDSYAMGWGVEQNETFADLLEESTSYKVLNSGISSYGTARQQILLSQLEKQNLKYVVWQYSENDFGENRTYVKNGFKLDIMSHEEYQRIKDKTRKRKYSLFMYFGRFMKQMTQQISGIELYSAARNTNDEEILYLLKTIKKANLEKHIKIILFEISGPEYLNNGFIGRLSAILEKEEFFELRQQIIVLNAQEVLDENKDYFVIDSHINKSGHYKIFESLREIISSH